MKLFRLQTRIQSWYQYNNVLREDRFFTSIFVFERIHPLGRDVFRFRGCVYSRHAVCITSDTSSIELNNCPSPNFLQATSVGAYFGQLLIIRKFCEFPFLFLRPCANDVELWDMALALGISVGTTKDSQISPSVWFLEAGSNSLHKSATAPYTLSWSTEITVRRIKSMVSSLPLMWMDFLPPPLLFNCPLSEALMARNTGYRSRQSWASWLPFTMPWVSYHFLTTKSQKWPTSVRELLGICRNSHGIRHTIFMVSLCSPNYVIAHWREDLNLVENSQRSESWENFQSSSIGSPSIRSKSLR